MGKDDCLQSSNDNSTHSLTMDEALAIIKANGGDDIDWRTKGAVTPVKNQGQYGTCWSFGATGTVEGMMVVTGKLPLQSISEQELIDCSPCGGYVGCCLTWYVNKEGGRANTEDSYPYKGRSGSCQSKSAQIAKLKIASRVCEANGANNNQDKVLADLMKYGPGSALIDAGCVEGTNQVLFLIVQRKLDQLIMPLSLLVLVLKVPNHIGSSRIHGVLLSVIRVITEWKEIPILLKLDVPEASLPFLLNII